MKANMPTSMAATANNNNKNNSNSDSDNGGGGGGGIVNSSKGGGGDGNQRKRKRHVNEAAQKFTSTIQTETSTYRQIIQRLKKVAEASVSSATSSLCTKFIRTKLKIEMKKECNGTSLGFSLHSRARCRY